MSKYNVPAAIRAIASDSEENSIYLKYTDKKAIAKKIFDELVKRLNIKDKTVKGFYMTDDKNDIGVLSQCQSLQALLELANNYGLDFDEKHKVSGEEISIREIMDIVVEEILEIVVNEETGICVFDASPFTTADQFVIGDVQYNYINAITWVLPTFLLVLKYHARIGEICKWENELIDVIKQGIKYINESFITSDIKNSDNLCVGWNFTKDCEEPSLFFTYTVTDCYLQFYKTFELYFAYKDEEKIANEKANRDYYKIPDDILTAYQRAQKTYERDVNRQIKEYNEFGKKLARFDEDNELIRILKIIDEDVENENSILYELKRKCQLVGEEIWRLTKSGLADNFYCNDLHSTISEEDIAMSTTNDALFNTAFIINTIINAGVDLAQKSIADVASSKMDVLRKKNEALGNELKAIEDKEDPNYQLIVSEITENEEEIRIAEIVHKKAQEEYNDILESCQLAIQRTFRVYDNFKKKSKEYIVDQFLVGFNERFIKHQELTKELRKRRIRIFSLTPILITTYNAISEYLIRYPQADMKKYLGYILENRNIVGRSKRWIWESDGFFSASNYYFVVALGEFYTYYETYEKLYAENFEKNEELKKEFQKEFKEQYERENVKRRIDDLEAKHDEKLRVATQKYNEEIQKRNAEIEELKAKLKNISTPIEDAVISVINRELQQQLPILLINFITAASKSLSVDSETVEVPEEHENFKKAMFEFLLSCMYPIIKSTKYDSNLSEEEYNKSISKMCIDFEKILVEYVTQLNDVVENGKSPLLKLLIEQGKF